MKGYTETSHRSRKKIIEQINYLYRRKKNPKTQTAHSKERSWELKNLHTFSDRMSMQLWMKFLRALKNVKLWLPYTQEKNKW